MPDATPPPSDASLLGALRGAVAARGDAPWLIAYRDDVSSDVVGDATDEADAAADPPAADAPRSALGFDAGWRAARAVAARLAELGAGPADRVAIAAGNRPATLLAYLGCWALGAVAQPLNLSASDAALGYALRHARPKLLLADDGLEARLRPLAGGTPLEPLAGIDARTEPLPEAALREPGGAAGAFLVYTSGTTGDPKGVLLSRGNLLANARATAAWHRLGPGDAWMTVLPIHHVNGAVVTGLAPFLAGATNVLCGRFSPRTFWRRLAAEGARAASVVPTLLEFLLAADDAAAAPRPATPRLRYLLCGAGPLLPETALRFEARFGVPICHGFGMSETTAYNTQMPLDLSDAERRARYQAHGFPSVGCALACNEVAVLRPDGSACAPLERGEIHVRGPSVMAGYLDDPEATARAFRSGPGGRDDWFASGDEGFWEEVGGRRYFYVSGRLKELIVRGGANLAPWEIDAALQSAPGVAFGLAVPFANRAYGEEVAGFVVPAEGARLDPDAVRRHAAARLPHSHAPKVVLVGRDIPFTATGKPKRLELARTLEPRLRPWREVQFREGEDPPSPPPDADA